VSNNLPPLGIYLNRDPSSFDNVRKHRGLWDRLDTWLMNKAFDTTSAVRGNYVAMDSLIEAITRYGSIGRYELFANPASIKNLEQRVTSHWRTPDDRVRIRSTSALSEEIDKLSLTALLTPSLVSGEPVRIRDCFSSKVFPIVILSHGFSRPTMLYDTFLRILLGNTYPCDSIICSSRASGAAMARIFEHLSEEVFRDFGLNLKFSGRLDQIPLCVDTETLKPLDKAESRRQCKLPKDSFILLYFGRISPLKADLYPLLAVFAILVRENANRKLLLVIAGTAEEPYRNALQEFIRSQSLEKHVRIVCDIPDNTKAAMFSAADIFVSPADSLQESFGLSPVEAMSCGVPQVVADWDGYRDTVVHGETGLLVPTLWTECDRDLRLTDMLFGWEYDHLSMGQSIAVDFERLRSSLQLMIDNNELRREMAIASRRRAEALYSYRVVAKAYEDLCLDLSETAKAVAVRTPPGSFMASHYFKFFRGHASHIIGDDSELSLSAFSEEAHVKWLLSKLANSSTDIEILNGDVIRFAIEELHRSASAEREGESMCKPKIKMGQLVDTVTKRGAYHQDFVRRNMMWMIKQGIVTVCLSDPMVPPYRVPV
jgi:D-inositol-3-phosphate glycosyltransferase